MFKVNIFRLIAVVLVVAMPKLFAGNALYMDGDNDYLQLFEPVIDNQPFTIEAWGIMYAPGGGIYNENCFFEQRSKETGFGAATVTILAKNAHDDEASFELRDSNSGRIKLFSQIQPFNEWHHYAGTVDSNVIKFYIDGILVTSYEFEFNGTFILDIDNISVGRHAYLDIVAGYFNGMIDEMRIWNYALSNEEIVAGMKTVVDLDDQEIASKLLAYWRFDEFYEFWKNDEHYVGVKDLSGNEHHGAFVDDATLIDVDYDPHVLQLTPFSLLTPESGAEIDNASVHFEWQSATQDDITISIEMRYDVFISETPDFENPFIHTVLGRTTFLDYELAWGNTYYWKVRAQNYANEELWSNEVFFFSLAQSPREIPMTRFRILSPANDAIIYTTAPYLLWEKATWIEELKDFELIYTIYLDSSPGFENPLTLQTFGETNFARVFDLKKGYTYFWKVKAENVNGEYVWCDNTAVFHVYIDASVDDNPSYPKQYALYPNFPNPFNPDTRIAFDVPVAEDVKLDVFDMNGRIVKTLIDSRMPPGTHQVVWNGTTDKGVDIVSGIYFYRLSGRSQNGDQIQFVKKMTFLK